jgi:hypothetical protein
MKPVFTNTSADISLYGVLFRCLDLLHKKCILIRTIRNPNTDIKIPSNCLKYVFSTNSLYTLLELGKDVVADVLRNKIDIRCFLLNMH